MEFPWRLFGQQPAVQDSCGSSVWAIPYAAHDKRLSKNLQRYWTAMESLILLHQHYLDRQKPAILLSTWRKDLDSDPKDFIVLRAQAKGYEFVHSSLHNADLVIIFDEAQRTFEDEEFSLGLVKQQIGPARFGNSPLAFLEPQQRVSITTLSIEDRPSIPLLYNRQEFDDVVTRFCRSPSSLLNLDTGAHGCIFEFTDGQPGAVDAVLKMLEKVYHA